MTTRLVVAPSHRARGVATLKKHSISSRRRRRYRAMRASETKTSAFYEEEEEEEIDRTRFSSAKRRGEERCSTSEETEMNNNNNNNSINARVFGEDAEKKARSMVLASAMALVLNGGIADDRFATANAMVSSSSSSSFEDGREYARSFDETARRRRTFDIAEASSSEQRASDAVATETNTSANIVKPELGQGFFKDLEIFIEREPPIAVGFLFLFLINGVWGVIFTLFIRETNAGPGGEFGKGLAALRKEIVKGIFKFFGGALGRFTK
jgi:hypothetical protein